MAKRKNNNGSKGRKNDETSGEGSKTGNSSGKKPKVEDEPEPEPRQPVKKGAIDKNSRSSGKKHKNGASIGEGSKVGDEREPREPVQKDVGKECKKEVTIDVRTSSSGRQRAQDTTVRFYCARWFFGILAGIFWLISVYTCRPRDSEALGLLFYCFPLAFSFILWGMKEGDRKLIPHMATLEYPYIGILTYYYIQALLCGASLVGSVRITLGKDIHDVYYLTSLLMSLLFWELALVYGNDFALADMMLALLLTKLNIKPQYLTGIASVFYLVRKGAISKMEETEKKLKKKKAIALLEDIKNCWLTTEERLQSEDCRSDLERKYPQFYQMRKSVLLLAADMKE